MKQKTDVGLQKKLLKILLDGNYDIHDGVIAMISIIITSCKSANMPNDLFKTITEKMYVSYLNSDLTKEEES